MPKFTLELHCEAGSTDDPESLRIVGRLSDSDGMATDFLGWLELLTLLECSVRDTAVVEQHMPR